MSDKTHEKQDRSISDPTQQEKPDPTSGDATNIIPVGVKKILTYITLKTGLVSIAIIVVLYLMLGLLNHTKRATEPALPAINNASVQQAAQTQQDLARSLADIQATLATLKANMAQPADKDVAALKATLDKTANGINTETDKQSQSIKISLNASHDSLITRLSDIKAQLTQISQALSPEVFSDPSLLPFTVDTIDFFQHQPIVTVIYANHASALEEHMSLAGWQLIDASFTDQFAEFINKQGQRVRVLSGLALAKQATNNQHTGGKL